MHHTNHHSPTKTSPARSFPSSKAISELKEIMIRDCGALCTDDELQDLGISLLRLSKIAVLAIARQKEVVTEATVDESLHRVEDISSADGHRDVVVGLRDDSVWDSCTAQVLRTFII